jgi:hypothetical protein
MKFIALNVVVFLACGVFVATQDAHPSNGATQNSDKLQCEGKSDGSRVFIENGEHVRHYCP